MVLINQNQTWLGLGVMVFVIVFASTTAHDHQKNGVLIQSKGKNSNNHDEQWEANGLKNGGDDYDWNNQDDYQHPEYSNDDPNQHNDSEEKITVEENKSQDSPSKAEKADNDKTSDESQKKKIVQDPIDDASNKTESNVSDVITPEKPQSIAGNETANNPKEVSGETENNTSAATETKTSDIVVAKSSNNETESKPEKSDTTESDLEQEETSGNIEIISSNQTEDNASDIPSSSVKPSPIVTEDVGGYDNQSNTTSETDSSPKGHMNSSSFRDWSVVVTSALISFALIFTILYFIRNALIRKRRADQRRLLNSSISAEGYFYGDGEGIGSGKFEL